MQCPQCKAWYPDAKAGRHVCGTARLVAPAAKPESESEQPARKGKLIVGIAQQFTLWIRGREARVPVAVAALCVMAGIAWYSYGVYQVSLVKAELAKAIGKDSGYTETILKIESEATGMTFKELFDLCDKSIDARTNLIVELRGLYPEINYALKDSLIEYLSTENQLTRAKRAFYQKSMTLNSSFKMYERARSEEYKAEYRVQLVEAVSEMASSATAFSVSYNKVLGEEQVLAEKMDQQNIRFVRVFEKYKGPNLDAARKQKKAVDTIQAVLIARAS